ncbi:MAG: hypothetical protein HY332_11810 [Chloroflexi bacterium]|nr:hypothetical protein [Chloroflexota bacterium]
MAVNVGVVGYGDIALKNYLPGTKALAGTVDIVQGQKPILSAEHARHVVEIMEKAVVASETGQAQTLTTTF